MEMGWSNSRGRGRSFYRGGRSRSPTNVVGRSQIRSIVIQVVTSLINKKFNVIIARKMVIFHMNVKRSSITKEIKVKTTQSTTTLKPT